MSPVHRRNFLKANGVVGLPGLLSPGALLANDKVKKMPGEDSRHVKLYGDREMFEPAEYLKELSDMQSQLYVVFNTRIECLLLVCDKQ